MNKINKTLRNRVEKIATEELKSLDRKAKTYIESALLSLIGLTKSYSNKYEIDHCNGRSSVLTDAFKKMAQKEAEKVASNHKFTKEDIANFKEAFDREVKSQMSYVIRDLAKQRATEEVQKIFDGVKIDVEELILGDKE